MKTREHVLSSIRRFLAETGMTEREFGLRSAGDHKLIPRIRQGMVTLSRIERAEAFIEAGGHPPDQPPPPPPAHEGRAA